MNPADFEIRYDGKRSCLVHNPTQTIMVVVDGLFEEWHDDFTYVNVPNRSIQGSEPVDTGTVDIE